MPTTQMGDSQEKGREYMVYTDQHGREWESWGDVKAKLHPCGPLTPARNWPHKAPWIPSQHYARFDGRNPTRFTWDYEAMLSDGIAALQRYRDVLFEAAKYFNVPNWDPADGPTPQMARDVGDPPLPLAPIRAARVGNGYILGLRAFDPEKQGDVTLREELAKFEIKRPTFEDDAEFADTVFSDRPVGSGGGRAKKVPQPAAV